MLWLSAWEKCCLKSPALLLRISTFLMSQAALIIPINEPRSNTKKTLLHSTATGTDPLWLIYLLQSQSIHNDVWRVTLQCLGSRLSKKVGGFRSERVAKGTYKHLVTQQRESDGAPSTEELCWAGIKQSSRYGNWSWDVVAFKWILALKRESIYKLLFLLLSKNVKYLMFGLGLLHFLTFYLQHYMVYSWFMACMCTPHQHMSIIIPPRSLRWEFN